MSGVLPLGEQSNWLSISAAFTTTPFFFKSFKPNQFFTPSVHSTSGPALVVCAYQFCVGPPAKFAHVGNKQYLYYHQKVLYTSPHPDTIHPPTHLPTYSLQCYILDVLLHIDVWKTIATAAALKLVAQHSSLEPHVLLPL